MAERTPLAAAQAEALLDVVRRHGGRLALDWDALRRLKYAGWTRTQVLAAANALAADGHVTIEHDRLAVLVLVAAEGAGR
ncbi:MAG TPA: hypothetical protein VD931_19510 [Baekduia sp.]|nr:hypothetical protein [Baekduia sp.]